MGMTRVINLRTRLISSAVIYGVVYGTCHLGFGGPVRIWLADAFALLLAFGIPSLLVSSPAQLWNHRVAVSSLVLSGLLSWDVLMTLLISKHDLFYGWLLFYPVGFFVMVALLFLHSAVVSVLEAVQHPIQSRSRH
jgi:hypothetical protein